MSFKVCIDAGHGGYDSGAVGNGLKEKDLTLSVALKLNELLTKDGRFETVMTRTGDYAPGHYETQLARELSERARISNEFGADFFISIHFNSSTDVNVHGCAALDNNGTGYAHKVADELLSEISQKEDIKSLGIEDTHTYFAVIRETKASALISESAFISNKGDISHFATEEGQQKLAEYHYNAICKAFGVEPKGISPTVNTTNVTILRSDSTVPTHDQVMSTINVLAQLPPPPKKQPVKDVAKANINGIDIVTHEELDQIIEDYAKKTSVSDDVKSLNDEVSLCVKKSELKDLVLEIVAQALSITVNRS